MKRTILVACIGIGALSGCSTIREKIESELDRLRDKPGAETPIPDQPGNPTQPGDQIDLAGVRWLHADISRWPVTSTLAVSIGGGTVRLDYDKAHAWPKGATAKDGTPCNANPWIFVKVDGQWTAATWEWFKIGQTTKPMSVVEGGHIKAGPLGGSWKPTSGEEYGWAVSTVARDAKRTLNERTNILLERWP